MGLAYGSELLKATAVQSFWNTFLAIQDPFDGLVFRRESTQSADTYARLGAAPMPEEWKGNVNAKDANEYTYTLTNKPWKAAVRVDKALIKYQQWDEIANLVANLGMKARAHQISLLSTEVIEGDAQTCDDGQFFFDDDHTDPGAEYTTSQDNDLTSAATAAGEPTAAEAATGIRAAINALHGFLDDRGDPYDVGTLDASSLVLMTPPERFTTMRQVLVADTLAAAGDNDLKGQFDLRINKFLTDTDRVYFFVKNAAHKPLILQESGGITFEDNMGSDDHQQTGDVTFSAYWWGIAGYGQWRTAVQYLWT